LAVRPLLYFLISGTAADDALLHACFLVREVTLMTRMTLLYAYFLVSEVC
jgi:hypothetical protein